MKPTAPASDEPRLPSLRVRWIVSALVAFHVGAVFLGPFSMPPQNSELASAGARFLALDGY